MALAQVEVLRPRESGSRSFRLAHPQSPSRRGASRARSILWPRSTARSSRSLGRWGCRTRSRAPSCSGWLWCTGGAFPAHTGGSRVNAPGIAMEAQTHTRSILSKHYFSLRTRGRWLFLREQTTHNNANTNPNNNNNNTTATKSRKQASVMLSYEVLPAASWRPGDRPSSAAAKSSQFPWISPPWLCGALSARQTARPRPGLPRLSSTPLRRPLALCAAPLLLLRPNMQYNKRSRWEVVREKRNGKNGHEAKNPVSYGYQRNHRVSTRTT